MKILKWLFNYSEKYQRALKSYRKGGLAGKITTLVLIALVTGATLACEYWTISLYPTSVGYGALTTLLLIALASLSLETLSIHSVVGFRSAIQSKVEEFAQDKTIEMAEKIEQEHGVDLLSDENKKKKKSHKGFDIFFSICCIILDVGLIVGMIVMFFKLALPI